MWVPSQGWQEPLEKEMATHSSILAWEIPRTEEPGEQQSRGSQKRWTRLNNIDNKELLIPELQTMEIQVSVVLSFGCKRLHF